MWTELKKLYADEWDFTVRDLDESQMRAAFGDFLDAKRVADCAKGLVGGEVMLLQPRGGGDRLAYVGLYQMESAAAAGKAYDALTELGRAKDKRMTSGSIVITKSEYGALKTRKPGRHEAASKRIDAMGSTIDVRLVVAEFDCYVIEILYSNTPVKDEDLVDCLERVCAFLEKK
jgi:hypothetical protein